MVQYECEACGFPISASYVNDHGSCSNCGSHLERISSPITQGTIHIGSWIFGLFVGIVAAPVFKELMEAGKRTATRIK